jgi:Ca-activated chloride channel family protein
MKKIRRFIFQWLLFTAVLWFTYHFFIKPSNTLPPLPLSSNTETNAIHAPPAVDLKIVAGSENKSLQPVIQAWAKQQGVNIQVSYQGSVDIYRLLQQGRNSEFDAVWPANHLWIELGDEQKVVKHEKSIMRSPVVLALKKSIAKKLDWIGNKQVSIQDILTASQQGKFRLATTSATQSNSGASAYLSFLYAMAGYPDTLSLQHLNNPEIQAKVKQLLSSIHRSSGSSGWLKEAFIEHPDRFDGMFNYEAMLIEANQAFIQQQQEPLCAIYPQEGLMVADSPLGLIDKGDADKEALFLQLQHYLLSAKVQQQIETTGRRTGLLGMSVTQADPAIWNPNWCIDTQRMIASIPIPKQQVIQAALNLYQTDLRKPSLTMWVLDVSGSMQGEGIAGLKQAMTTLLDSEQAKVHLLQTGKNDVTYIIPFNHQISAVWEIKGNRSVELQRALNSVNSLVADGGTDIYRALGTALTTLTPYYDKGTLWNYLPAIVLMTDGRSDETNYMAFQALTQDLAYAKDIPIHAIAFGDADKQQLQALTQQFVGRLFDSQGDLVKTLRDAKGYN